MKKMISILVLAFAAASALAQPKSDPAVSPKPDPMLRQLDAFAGNWKCSGTAFASPMSPQHATTGEVWMKLDMNGYWMTFTYAEKKTTENPMPFQVNGFLGYDTEIHKLVMGSVDNMGGYSTASSDGWNGDTIVYSGPWHMGGMTVNGRDSFTKKGAREMIHAASIEQNGEWTKLDEETCVRK
ncbi:MAG: DUF1579 family protein [Acidobacteriota bacterium]